MKAIKEAFFYKFLLVGILFLLLFPDNLRAQLPPARVQLTTTATGNLLQWEDGGSNGATTLIRYEIGRSTTRGAGYGVIGNTTGLIFTDTTAVAGTTYYYVIRDVHSSGTTAWSEETIRFYPFAGATAAATSYKNEKVVKASWPVYDNEIVKTFVGLGTTPGGADVVGFIDVGHAIEHTFSGVTLQEGLTYYVTVRVQNSSGFLGNYGVSTCSSPGFQFTMARNLTDSTDATFFNNARARVMTNINAASVSIQNFANNQQRRYRAPLTLTEPGIESRFNAPIEVILPDPTIPTNFNTARQQIRVADELGNEVPSNVVSAGPQMITSDLYNSGTEFTTFVPGFSQGGNGSLQKLAGQLELRAYTNNGNQRTYVTDVPVDLTGWEEVVISWSNNGNANNGNESYFIVSPNKNNDHSNFEGRVFLRNTFATREDSIDVSAINGTRFIRVHSRRNTRDSRVNVFRIFLRRTGPNAATLVLIGNIPQGGTKDYWVFWGGGNAANADFISNSNDTSQRAFSRYYSRKLLPPGIETDPISSWTKLAVTVGDWYDRGGTWVTLPWNFPYFSTTRSLWFLAIKGTLTGVDYRDYSNTWNEFIQNAANRDMISALWLDTSIRDTDPQPQNIGYYTIRKDAGLPSDRQGFFWRANRYGLLDDIYMFQTFLYQSGDITHRYEYLTYQGLWTQGTWDNPVNITHNTVGISHNNNADYFWSTPLREGIGQTPTSFFQYKNAVNFSVGPTEDTGNPARGFAGHIDSHIFDSRAATPNWLTMEYQVTANGGRFNFLLRSGPTPEPDGSWTAWSQVVTEATANGSVAVPAANNHRFIQYRCVFIKDNTGATPTLNRVNFFCRGLEIVRVTANTPDGVSQGQDGIPVRVAIRNFHSADISLNSIALNYSLGTYTQTLNSPALPSTITPGDEVEFEFLVNVDANSPVGTATVDALATGTSGGLTFNDSDADIPHIWLVRKKAELTISQIDATPPTVNKGQTVLVRMLINNTGGTPLIFDTASLTFSLGLYNPVTLNSPAAGFVVPDGGSMIATFSVTVRNDSPSGVAVLDGRASGRNQLSNKITSSTAALITDSWIVQNPAQLVINSVVASDTVYRGQTNIPVFITVSNIGEALAIWETSILLPFFTLGTYDAETAKTLFPIDVFGGLNALAEYWINIAENSATGTSVVDAGIDGIDANTLTPIFANNAIFPSEWTIIGEKIKNFKDPALLFESTSFNRPTAGTLDIFARADDLAPLKEFTVRWYQPDGTQFDFSSPPLTSDASGTISHQIAIDNSVPFGLWTVKLTNPLNTFVACQNFFEVVSPANIQAKIDLPARVSVGQVFNASTTITNIGGAVVKTCEPGNFIKTGPGNANLTSGPLPVIQDIAGNSAATYTYQWQATTAGNFSISGNASGYDGNSDDLIRTATVTSNICLVQTPPNLLVVSINEDYGTVYRNQQNLTVTMRIRNTGQATAIVDAASLTFSIGSHTQSLNLPATFPLTLAGNTTTDLVYTVGITTNSPTGAVTVGGSFRAYDSNDPTSWYNITGGNGAWTIADVVAICSANSSYNPEQYAFNIGQTVYARFTNLPLNTNFRIRFYNQELDGSPVKTSPALNSGAYGVCDDLWTLVTGSQLRRWRVIIDNGTAGAVGTIFGIQYFDVQNPGNLQATLSLSPSSVFVGETITATLIASNTVTSGSTIGSATPVALKKTAASTGNANQVSGPAPASTDVQAGSSGIYSWTYEATADTGLIGSYSLIASLTYSVTGFDVNTSNVVNSNQAVSNGIFIYRRDLNIGSSTLDNLSLAPGETGSWLNFSVINSGNYHLNNVKWATADLRNESSDYISKAYLEFNPAPLGFIAAGNSTIAAHRIEIPYNQASGSYIATMSVYEDLNSNDNRDYFEPARLFSVQVIVPSQKLIVISNPEINLENWSQGQTTGIVKLNYFNAGNLDLDSLKVLQTTGSATFITTDPVAPGFLPVGGVGSLDVYSAIPLAANTGIYIATYTLYDDDNNNNVIDPTEPRQTFTVRIGVGIKSFNITPAFVDSGPATPTYTVEGIPIQINNSGELDLTRLKANLPILVSGANSIASDNIAIFLPAIAPSMTNTGSTINIYVPAGTPIGSYTGLVNVFEDNNNNGTYDSGEASASFTLMADVRRYHAVQVIPSTIDFGDLSAGTGKTVSVLCRNIGNVNLDRLLWEKVNLTSGANSIPGTSYSFLPNELPFLVAPGQLFTRNVSITIPGGQADGSYSGNSTWLYDDAVINSLRDLPEPQDSFLVTCRVGNHFINIIEAGQALSGNPFSTTSSVNFNVRNEGSLTISNPKATATVLLGPGDPIPATSSVFLPVSIGYILQNQTKLFSWRVNIPANQAPGVYTGTVTVWNDSNNDGIINAGEASDNANLTLTVLSKKVIEVLQKPIEMGAQTQGNTFNKDMEIWNRGNLPLDFLTGLSATAVTTGGDSIPAASITFALPHQNLAIGASMVATVTAVVGIPQSNGLYLATLRIYDDYAPNNGAYSVNEESDAFQMRLTVGEKSVHATNVTFPASNPGVTATSNSGTVSNTSEVQLARLRWGPGQLVNQDNFAITIPPASLTFTPNAATLSPINGLSSKLFTAQVNIGPNQLHGTYIGTHTIWEDDDMNGIMHLTNEASSTFITTLVINPVDQIDIITTPVNMLRVQAGRGSGDNKADVIIRNTGNTVLSFLATPYTFSPFQHESVSDFIQNSLIQWELPAFVDPGQTVTGKLYLNNIPATQTVGIYNGIATLTAVSAFGNTSDSTPFTVEVMPPGPNFASGTVYQEIATYTFDPANPSFTSQRFILSAWIAPGNGSGTVGFAIVDSDSKVVDQVSIDVPTGAFNDMNPGGLTLVSQGILTSVDSPDPVFNRWYRAYVVFDYQYDQSVASSTWIMLHNRNTDPLIPVDVLFDGVQLERGLTADQTLPTSYNQGPKLVSPSREIDLQGRMQYFQW